MGGMSVFGGKKRPCEECPSRTLELGGVPEPKKSLFPKLSPGPLGVSPCLWGCPRASGGAPRALLGPLGPHRAHGGRPPLWGPWGPIGPYVGPMWASEHVAATSLSSSLTVPQAVEARFSISQV